MADINKHKIKLREVNRHLVCRLCRGYFVDATTIAECLHSFCRSCIIKYLEKNSFCPICEVQIHKTKPYLNLRLDKALQDVVYKLVPGLYHNEMTRRRNFYATRPDQIPVTTPEQRGLEERLIFSPEDSISLSLEYMESPETEIESVSSRSSDSGEDFPLQLGLMKVRRGDSSSRKESVDSNEPSAYPKRFLQCPAVVSIGILKKFISTKFDLSPKIQVDIIHKRVPLPDHYTLMDVAYIFTWKRMAPIRLFYQLFNMRLEKITEESPPPVTEIVPPPKLLKQPKSPATLIKVEKPTVLPPSTTPMGTVPIKKLPTPLTNRIPNSGPKATTPTDKKDIAIAPKIEPPKSVPKIVNGSVGMKLDAAKRVENTQPKCPVQFPKPSIVSKPIEPCRKTPEIVCASTKKDEKTSDSSKGTAVEEKPLGDSNKNLKMPEKKKSVDEKEINKQEKLNKPVEPEKKVNNPIVKPSPKEIGSPKTVPLKENVPIKNPQPEIKKDIPQKSENLLLNPISGKLEPEPPPSPDREKCKKIEDKPIIKSCVQQLKTFRKEKSTAAKQLSKSPNSVTITTSVKKDKPLPKEEANVSIEIKTDSKNTSEYDFESVSPPSRIMSLQEYTQSVLYKVKYGKNNTKSINSNKQTVNSKDIEEPKKDKSKTVPSLYRINPDKRGANGVKMTKTKDDKLPKLINIETSPEGKINDSPPKPIKIENRGGEYSIKQSTDDNKSSTPNGKTTDETELLRLLLKRRELGKGNQLDGPPAKKQKSPSTSPKAQKPTTPVDLSNNEQSYQKNPLENLMELAKKPSDCKKDQNMLEMLINIAQKQSIEPLLKVPQYPSSTSKQDVSPGAISHAIQYFQKLSSDMDLMGANSQIEQNMSPRLPNIVTLQQFYQQQIEFVRMLKRKQLMTAELPAKTPKLSPSRDNKKQSTTEETTLKNVERTLSQIKEQAEIQSRLVAAQNYKNLPALLQYYNQAGSQLLRSNASPPRAGMAPSAFKPSQSSPNSQQSPPMINPEAHRHILASQQQMHNVGLTPEMTFHEMFQQYLTQQLKMNQRKADTKNISPPLKSNSPSDKGVVSPKISTLSESSVQSAAPPTST